MPNTEGKTQKENTPQKAGTGGEVSMSPSTTIDTHIDTQINTQVFTGFDYDGPSGFPGIGMAPEKENDLPGPVSNKAPEKEPAKEKPVKKNPTPEEEASMLVERYKDNYTGLTNHIRHRIPSDEKLVAALIEEIGYWKSDQLIAEMVLTFKTHQLIRVKPSILKLFVNTLNDLDIEDRSRMALDRIQQAVELRKKAPEMDFGKLAGQLKKELSKTNKEEIDNSKVESVYNQVKNDREALNQLKLYYPGSLMVDLGGSDWMKYFMLTSISEGKEDEGVMVSGGLVLVESTESTTGNEFRYVVEGGDNPSAICSYYRVDMKVLMKLNGWADIDNITIYPKQEIKMPHDLYIPPNELIAYKNKKGGIELLRIDGVTINQEATVPTEVAEQLAALIKQGTYINQRKIIEQLKRLNGSRLLLEQVKADYATLTGKSLEESIKKEFTNSRGNMPSNLKNAYNQIMAYMRLDKTPHLDEEQLLLAKYQDRGDQQDNTIKLWKGLSISELTGRAHFALLPAMTGKKVEVDNQELLSALASLRFRKANIDRFLALYAQSYGSSFINDLNRAAANKYDTYVQGLYIGEVDTSGKTTLNSLSMATVNAVHNYLTPDESASKSNTIVLEDRTAHYQLKYDKFGNAKLDYQFAPGTFIKYQKKQGDPPVSYYVAQDGDTFWDLHRKFRIPYKDLLAMSNIDAPAQKENPGKGGNKITIRKGQVIRIPAYTLKGQTYIRVEGGKVCVEAEGLGNVRFVDGGSYPVHADTYNPYFIETILKDLLESQEGTGVSSLNFKLDLYVKSRLVYFIYVQAGLRGEASAAIGDDRWFEVTCKLKFQLKAGVEGIGSIEKGFTVLGQTNAFHNIEHFATHFNHDIYNFLLDENEVLKGFINYWDDEDRQDLLGKGYYTKSAKKFKTKAFGSNLEKSSQAYSQIEAPRHIGHKKDEEESSTSIKKPSKDFLKSRGVNADAFNVEYLTFIDNEFLTVSREKISGDMNKDNIGEWLYLEIKITLQNLKNLHKDVISNPKGFLASQNTGQLEALLKKMTDAAEPFVTTAVLMGDFSDKRKRKAVSKSMQDKLFGNKPKWGEVEVDGGVVLDICYQRINNNWVLQYNRASAIVEAKYNKEKLFVSNSVLAISGGVDFEATYKRSFYEKPGTDSISYISTLYNGFMLQRDNDEDKGSRKEAFMQAQDKRLAEQRKNPGIKGKKTGQQAEAEDIAKYWNIFESKYEESYFTNNNWEKYKEQNIEALQELFKKFLEPIIEYKNATEWSEVKGLKFIDSDQAKDFLGENPEFALMKKFGVKDDELKIVDASDLSNNLVLFEQHVLFNLFKEQQKYEFDYFYYKQN